MSEQEFNERLADEEQAQKKVANDAVVPSKKGGEGKMTKKEKGLLLAKGLVAAGAVATGFIAGFFKGKKSTKNEAVEETTENVEEEEESVETEEEAPE